MDSITSDGFRVFVGVTLAALLAWRFVDKNRPTDDQPLLGWLAFAGFVTGFIATGWVVAGAISLFLVLLIGGFAPLLANSFPDSAPIRQHSGPPTMGGPSRGGMRLPGAAVRDLREAMQSGDPEQMEETISWWEGQED